MITIIASTNRANSYSLQTARYYQRMIEKSGLEASILSLDLLPDDIIHADMYDKQKPASFEPFQSIITQTSKFLFIIPEYNGSFLGILKVMVDTCRFHECFYGKNAVLVGILSVTNGNIRGLVH